MTKLNKIKRLLARLLYQIIIIIFIAIIALLLASCKEADSDSSTTASTTTTSTPTDNTPADASTDIKPPPVIPEPPDPVITLSLLTENGTLYFYDDTTFIYQDNTDPVSCGSKCFTDGNTTNIYDEQGQISSTEELAIKPDFIIDNIIIENIPPSVAKDMGAQAKNYVRIYLDGIELAGKLIWYLNRYTAVDFIKTNSGAYIIIDSTGAYHSLNGTTGINHAKNLLIHDFAGATARINGHPVTWVQGYFGNAKHWQRTGDTWISNNGYEYLDGVLYEQANKMWIWNTGPYPIALPGVERPVVISAGGGGYWIEANTGWLFKFTDRIDLVSRIYQGDGTRLSGIATSKELAPVIIGQDLYFNYDGSVWKLDILTGIIEIFYAGSATIEEW